MCLIISTKRSVAAAKFLVKATKNSFVVPNFVAVTKPFFSVQAELSVNIARHLTLPNLTLLNLSSLNDLSR